MRFFGFILLGVLFLVSPSQSHAQAAPVLRHGLNLSSWLANAPRQPLFAHDFAQIKAAGFDHIRLPFNPAYVGFKFSPQGGNADSPQGGNADQIDFIPLDRALALAEQYDLPVILDIHPDGAFIDTLEQEDWAEKQFVALWQVIAQRYKDRPASGLIFELLNEPQYYKWETRWARLSTRLIESIHAISPQRLIVVSAPHGSSIDGLSFLKPAQDPRILYAFHFYEPYMVTHQGIHQGFEKKMLRFFRKVPYPAALAVNDALLYAPQAPNPSQAASELSDYIAAGWDAAPIKARIDVARDWADQHHVRLLCGEYGVLRNHIDAGSRYRWIRDARAAMDADGIGWELWDYADLFGIATPSNPSAPDPVDGAIRMIDPHKGTRIFEPQALDALGLNRTEPR